MSYPYRSNRDAGEVTDAVIDGRPDFSNPNFGITFAKKFPPYVFSVNRNGALVHRVAAVQLHWYVAGPGGHTLLRLRRPRMTADLVCGGFRFLVGAKSRTCLVPNPDALLCGRCHGEVATFGKHGAATKAGIRKQDAHIKLGCVVKAY